MFPEHLLCPQEGLDAGSSREDKVLLPCNLHRIAGVMENSLESGQRWKQAGRCEGGRLGLQPLIPPGFVPEQRSPTLGLQASTGPQPFRNQAAQQ